MQLFEHQSFIKPGLSGLVTGVIIHKCKMSDKWIFVRERMI